MADFVGVVLEDGGEVSIFLELHDGVGEGDERGRVQTECESVAECAGLRGAKAMTPRKRLTFLNRLIRRFQM